MHLTIDEIVDIAEGTRTEASAPHLAGCEPCRAQVAELRATLTAAREVAVPEPSPLFWDHLSARVGEAVAAEGAPARSRSIGGALAGFFDAHPFQAGVLSAAFALLFAVIVAPRHAPSAPSGTPAAVASADAAAPRELLNDVMPDEDASLTVVASLTDAVDMDTVREAGLAPGGSAEHAVTHMSAGELRELGRILQEEMARPGA